MCRQFTLTVEDWSEILEAYGVLDDDYKEFRYGPRYNIKTTEDVVTILSDGTKNRIGRMRWGLIPSWAKDPKIGAKMVNARVETVAEKPAFRNLLTRKRCLVLADSFFEWKHEGKEKIPYRFSLKNRKVFAFAGLWDTWQSPTGENVHTATIITGPPNETVAQIHDREPIILSQNAEKIWLDRSNQDKELLTSLLHSERSHDMYSYRVSNIIGKRGVDSPECIKEVS